MRWPGSKFERVSGGLLVSARVVDVAASSTRACATCRPVIDCDSPYRYEPLTKKPLRNGRSTLNAIVHASPLSVLVRSDHVAEARVPSAASRRSGRPSRAVPVGVMFRFWYLMSLMFFE